MLTTSRPGNEICLSLIHEPGHAILHPTGQAHDLVPCKITLDLKNDSCTPQRT
jgi:Zn-dependent peptidase ImmA (M78 family)